MTDDEIETIEAEAREALSAWTDNGRQPDGLDGNDAWEWAADSGVAACERVVALAAEVRRLRKLHDACATLDAWNKEREPRYTIGGGKMAGADGTGWHAETGSGVGSATIFTASLADTIAELAAAVKP